MLKLAKSLPAIKAKKVYRYFAPYYSISGRIAWKGFATALGAAKFVAKQEILDEVLGPKEWHYGPVDQYGGGDEWFTRTKLPKEEFAQKMFDYGFQCREGADLYGEPVFCCPERYGFCGLKYKAEVSRRAQELLNREAQSA